MSLKVITASRAGFCSGVRRAFDRVCNAARELGPGTTLGPLAHNEKVCQRLEELGVAVIDSPDQVRGAFVAVRTHGLPPAAWRELQEQVGESVAVLDLTCPRVRRVQRLVAREAAAGKKVFIFGTPQHPEVVGLTGWAGNLATVLEEPDQLADYDLSTPSCLVTQTTAGADAFAALAVKYGDMASEGVVFSTICPETDLRHREALEMAPDVDAFVVIGSELSANSVALYKYCRHLKPSCRVSCAKELDPSFFEPYKVIGVTAGASTPPWTIKEVVKRMENENMEREDLQQSGVSEQEEKEGETPREDTVLEEAPREEVGEEGSPVAEDSREEDSPQSDGEDDAQETIGDETPEMQAVKEGEEEREGTESSSAEESAAEGMEEHFQFDGEVKVAQVGEQVIGKVARVTDDEVFVDIGAKTEAILPASEVHLGKDQTLADMFTPESDIEVTVLEADEQEGRVIVSHRRLARDRRLKEMEEALNEERLMEGRVKQVVPAGMVVDLGDGLEGFMPGSLVDTRYIPDFKDFLNQTIPFKILELDRNRGKLILSRKKVIEEEGLQRKEETLTALEAGQTINGTVKRLTNFGAFVDVGGIDGLVHISELAWERVGHPGEVLKTGQEVTVKVLEVIPERERISLSIRKTLPDPWTRAVEELESGQVIKGRITRLVNFGAFVEIKPGVEGLAHISQLADYHVNHPSELLQEGQEVDVKILEVKAKAKRISLSMKEASGVKAPPQPVENESMDNGNVTLGDVFGNLFDLEEKSEDPASETAEELKEEDKAALEGDEEVQPEEGSED